jgi:tetratricopeptide (TPR) repeat protein
MSLMNIGVILADAGRLDEALEHHRRALSIMTETLDRTHSDLALAFDNVGYVLELQGHYEEAATSCEKARAAWESTLGPTHRLLAYALTCEGNSRLGSGQAKEASPLLERALSIREAQPVDPVDLARTRFAVARALRALHADPARALSLAIEARDAYARAGNRGKRDLPLVEAWLATSQSGTSHEGH